MHFFLTHFSIVVMLYCHGNVYIKYCQSIKRKTNNNKKNFKKNMDSIFSMLIIHEILTINPGINPGIEPATFRKLP